MKKTVLITSGIVTISLLIWDYIGNFRLCGGKEWGSCVDLLANLETVFFPILPLFLFSLITYKMREEVFQTWWKFARVWMPISMVAILLAPAYASDWMFPIDKGRIAFFTSLVFIIMSFILIIRAKLTERK